ncbi:MAG: RNA polymerase sigma factor [Gemmataceae bacterium]
MLQVHLESGVADAQLLEHYLKTRSSSPFETLVERHRQMVFRTCARVLGHDQHEAEDAMQAVFVLLAQHPDRVNVSVSVWLHAAARRTAGNMVRSNLRRKQREYDSWEDKAPGSDPDFELQEELDLALAQLPAPLREAVVLRYLEGRDQEDAARIAGCPRGTLARRAKEGLERLRVLLNRRGTLVTAGLLLSLLCAESATAAPAISTTSLIIGKAGIGKLIALAKTWQATAAAMAVVAATAGAIPTPRPAQFVMSADNRYELYVNGQLAATGDNWFVADTHDLRLPPGKNVLALKIVDEGTVGGLLAELQVNGQRLHTGSGTWKVTSEPGAGWMQPGHDDASWQPATAYGPLGTAPWSSRVEGFPADSKAQWLWSEHNRPERTNDRVVYFRFTVEVE